MFHFPFIDKFCEIIELYVEHTQYDFICAGV